MTTFIVIIGFIGLLIANFIIFMYFSMSYHNEYNRAETYRIDLERYKNRCSMFEKLQTINEKGN